MMTWIEHDICVFLIIYHINKKLNILKEKYISLTPLEAEPEM